MTWERLAEVVMESRSTIGTILFVLGVGIVAMLLPNVLRYAIQSDGYLREYESIRLALATMMVTGGWHLRHVGRWDSESRSLLPVIMLVAAACILLEGWIAFNHIFPPPPTRPLRPRRPI